MIPLLSDPGLFVIYKALAMSQRLCKRACQSRRGRRFSNSSALKLQCFLQDWPLLDYVARNEVNAIPKLIRYFQRSLEPDLTRQSDAHEFLICVQEMFSLNLPLQERQGQRHCKKCGRTSPVSYQALPPVFPISIPEGRTIRMRKKNLLKTLLSVFDEKQVVVCDQCKQEGVN